MKKEMFLEHAYIERAFDKELNQDGKTLFKYLGVIIVIKLFPLKQQKF